MKNTYAPREFAALVGRTVKTLQKWDREGILPAHRSPSQRRYYTHDQYLAYTGRNTPVKQTVTYCRVSSAGQKTDLASQRSAVELFCIASGRAVSLKVEDIGSGLNYQRKGFVSLLEKVEQSRSS